MKKVMIPLIVVPAFCLFITIVFGGCSLGQIDLIKFPEPDGTKIGAIWNDFDGNGHRRYLTAEEFQQLVDKGVRVRVIEIQSVENATYWIDRLLGSRTKEGQVALWTFSRDDAMSSAYRLWGTTPYSYESYYDSYDYESSDLPVRTKI